MLRRRSVAVSPHCPVAIDPGSTATGQHIEMLRHAWLARSAAQSQADAPDGGVPA